MHCNFLSSNGYRYYPQRQLSTRLTNVTHVYMIILNLASMERKRLRKWNILDPSATFTISFLRLKLYNPAPLVDTYRASSNLEPQ